MTHSVSLPFEVLGQVGPILAWIEGEHGSRLPLTWTSGARPFHKRERSWLLQEFPTYSYDTAEEIIDGARSQHGIGRPKPTRLPAPPGGRRESLDPPRGYDLLAAFRQLNAHFFSWTGTEPRVRKHRMVDLHELGIRFPAGHIVRHAHARAVSEGVLDFDEALKLPELVSLLPSNSFGLRSLVRRGLSESHLHLTAVISGEENWADNLLRPMTANSIRGRSAEERRLLVLNLLAGRVLAVAVRMSLEKLEQDFVVRPQRLLEGLDRVYFARTEEAGQEEIRRLEDAIGDAVHGGEKWESKSRSQKSSPDRPRPLIQAPADKAYDFLLRWISPTAWRLQDMARRSSLPGNVPEKPRDRHALVHRLHFAAHLRLVQLSQGEQIGTKESGGRGGSASVRKSRVRLPDPRRYFLHGALYRYLVCRTHHWQLATQQGKTTGLRNFKKYFDAPQRRLPELPSLDEAELVFDRLRQWRGLRVLEGRVSPPNRPHDLVPWILAHARPGDRRLEKFGLVVHFKKENERDEDPSSFSQIPTPVPRLRWGRRRRMVREEGQRLYRLLRRPTPVTPFVVGIDACNLELETPPEVFAPVFRFLREHPISLPSEGRRFSPYVRLEDSIRRLAARRSLGMTYHVGEDFRHLLSGLRAICEVVEFLKPQPGDRLGHGTALALNPANWLEQNGYQAVLPRLEWLDTLVWVHHFLGPGDDVVGRLALEDRIQRLSWKVYSVALSKVYDPLNLYSYGAKENDEEEPEPKPDRRSPRRRGLLDWDWSPLTLWDAWSLRQLDPSQVDIPRLFQGELRLRPLRSFTEESRRWYSVQERALKSVEKTVGSRNAYLLLALYWMSPEVREAGEEIEIVDMQKNKDDWLKLCELAEERMKTLIHERELVVEANPSSNRIIGPMAHYGQHHVFELTLDEKNRLARQVRVSINTDNPAVCNTTLAHEYYLLGEILEGRGVVEAEVEKWLEWLRTNGETYNFARPLPKALESLDMENLLNWLGRIRPGVLGARSRHGKFEEFWSWIRDTRLRRYGFTEESIAQEAPLLERLASLEGRSGLRL